MANSKLKPRPHSNAGPRSEAGAKSQPVYVVDAFVTELFTGNPAAVCVTERAAPRRWMQLVAREMNLAETAFLHRAGRGYRLRWFTPTVEVDLCGHATLASAHVLWETGQLARGETARFQTLSGLLEARQTDGGIELNFPARPSEPVRPAPRALSRVLGAKPVWVGRASYDFLVELESEGAVRDLRPDIGALAELGAGVGARGAIVTARSSDKSYDFVSRFFAPGAGVDEDPVTGSAHCALGPYWAAKLGKTEMVGYQASARGGVVGVRLDGDRVRLAGRAVTMLRGELLH